MVIFTFKAVFVPALQELGRVTAENPLGSPNKPDRALRREALYTILRGKKDLCK